jgi:hypothetical protein
MSAEPPEDIDRAAIEAHAQRTAEQTALRKVRKTLDAIEDAENARRRSLRRLLIVCGLLAAIGAWFLWGLIFGGSGVPKAPPMQVPATLQQKL